MQRSICWLIAASAVIVAGVGGGEAIAAQVAAAAPTSRSQSHVVLRLPFAQSQGRLL